MTERFISADCTKINYMGRIDFSNPEKPLLIYAGSNLRFRFTGKHLSITVSSFSFDTDIRIGYLIDGKEGCIIIERNMLKSYTAFPKQEISFNRYADSLRFSIPVSSSLHEHSFILFKRLDGEHLMTFEGLFIDNDADIICPDPVPSRKIEFYGDSVCCGSVCEAVEYTGLADPEGDNSRYHNAWHAFPMITARLLNAQVNNISQGGLAVMDGNGYCFSPFYPGFETIYSKLQYISYYPCSSWDFSKFTPHVVVIALGQNDPHKEGYTDNNIFEHSFREKWKTAYCCVLNNLMNLYPQSVFVLTMTILNHDPEWDTAIDEIYSQINQNRVYRFRFRRNGCATHGHPRIHEQEEMACELTEFLLSLGDSIWNNTSHPERDSLQ